MNGEEQEILLKEEASFAPKSLWLDAWRRMRRDRLAVASLVVIALYTLLALAAKLGFIATPWDAEVGTAYAAPSLASLKTIFGTDIFGRSVLHKVIHGTRIAMSVGLVTSLIAIPIGVTLGALAGYFGGLVDEAIVWFYTTLSSIPSIMLLVAFTYVLGKGIFSVYIALGVTGWIGLARLIRGEFIKHKHREYVIAAESIGAGHVKRIFRHILPNVSHIVIINFSLQFQTAIKSEVILSYLGLGVQGQPSWGVMIDDSKLELARGVWWQLSAATLAMFFVVLAFNIFGDALRDALDPKLKKG
ncbi:MAG: ABC transporter permease [Deltaproteobacteria bacterium]|nr:ABC transporter permease [Deltaproteobacteria bacterium]